jgi:hypothetical protein
MGNQNSGRISKLQRLAEKHPNAIPSMKGKEYIKPATKKSLETVKKVLKEYKKTGAIDRACEKAKISETTFYYHIKKYPECMELARACGLGLKGDPTIRVINAKPSAEKVPESAFSIFDLPTRKEWTDVQKQDAVKKIMEALQNGVPFGYAVRYSGTNKKLLTEWVTAEPGLLDVLLQAEAKWAVTFFKCLTKAAVVAAEKGKFLEIVQGAERRFASQWGQVQSIDINLKNDKGDEAHLLLDKKTMDVQFEKEQEMEIEEI